MDKKVGCKSIYFFKAANPYIGQAYKGDGGSKSGLEYWTDGLESAAVRVGCWICFLDVLRRAQRCSALLCFLKTTSVFVSLVTRAVAPF